jgi:SAM-dependent methyltransferase
MRLELDQIQDFYESCYTASSDGEKWARWRALGAVTKVDHVASLLEQARIGSVESVVEIGCGDGAVLEALARRGIGCSHSGMDISSSAVALAASRPGVTDARQFDGKRIPAPDGAWDLAIATHVLEHVPAPGSLVEELVRVARRAIVVEVPLERNLSARRPGARAASEAAGHLHRFGRAAVREMLVRTGWRVAAEALDPLPLAVHMFAAETGARHVKGWAKWLVRSAVTTVPPLAERLITLHYAVIATPPH